MSIDKVINAARGEIGYRERGTNDTKFNHWLGRIPGYPAGGFGYPWCHSFVSWCLDQGGEAKAGPRTAGCEVGVSWFRARGRYGRTPHVGDLVYYGAGGGTHVELVVAVTSSTITTIGGNTSGSLGGAYFNGNGVYRKVVSRSSSRIHGYGRPVYSTPSPPREDDPMPEYVSVGIEAPQQVRPSAGEDDWHTLEWGAEYSDTEEQHAKDGMSVLMPGVRAQYGLGVGLKVKGLTTGVQVRIRAVEVKPDPKGPDKVVNEGLVAERYAARSSMDIDYTNPVDVLDAGNRVRIQVQHNGLGPATISQGTGKVHFWRSPTGKE